MTKTLVDQLSQYAAYHRDRRNIATHLLGIPMIVLAVAVLLARPKLLLAGWPVSLATLVAAASVLFYLRLDLRFGAVMAALMALTVVAAQGIGAWSTGAWLGIGLGLFAVGWVIQFIGHTFEGRKPAFIDDVVGLIIGPLFVVAELAFMAGLRREVAAQVTERAGPLRNSRLPSKAAKPATPTA